MRTRTLTGLSVALAAAGLASAGIGMHVTHTLHPVIGGLALIVTAVIPASAAQARATTLTAEQRAAERAAGYRQGLRHAALGLLEPTTSTRIDTEHGRRTE